MKTLKNDFLNRDSKMVNKYAFASNITQNWVNVLVPFSMNYRRKITASQISRETKIPQQTVSRIMKSMVETGCIDYTCDGKNKLFSINWEIFSSFILMQIVENQKALSFNLKNPKIATILQNLKNYCESIIVFGSYASGDFDKESDLDLVVFSAEKKLFENEKRKYPIEINCHFSSYSEFGKLLKQKNALAIEVYSNHILLKDTSKLMEVFLNG